MRRQNTAFPVLAEGCRHFGADSILAVTSYRFRPTVSQSSSLRKGVVQVVGSTITLRVSRGGAPLVTLSATDSYYLTGGTPMLWICCGEATPQRYGGSWRAGRVTR
jgi:hypothetical protein